MKGMEQVKKAAAAQENNQGGEISTLNRYGRFFFALFGLIFVVCIIVQVFLAGMAVFVDQDWEPHTTFIHMFEFVPIIMFAVSFIGRVPQAIRWSSLGLFVMILLQYVTAKAFSGVWLAALHPVIAVLLFWTAMRIVKPTWKWMIGNQSK
jgi:putative tricarboxylic transport membrane protein